MSSKLGLTGVSILFALATLTAWGGGGGGNSTFPPSPVAAGTVPSSVIVDPSGKFAYVANVLSNDVSAYTINATTGALTSIGAPVAAGTNPLSVTVDPSGKFVYVANGASNNVSAYTINATTGVLTPLR